jgi:hypothetical protein
MLVPFLCYVFLRWFLPEGDPMSRKIVMAELQKLGIEINNGKISKEDVRRVLSGLSRPTQAAEENKKSLKPPKKWWDKMVKQIKENNPKYSMDQISKTIGNIWYNKLSASKRKSIRERFGLEYGAANAASSAVDDAKEVESTLKSLADKAQLLLQSTLEYQKVLDKHNVQDLLPSQAVFQNKVRDALEKVLVMI